MRHDCATARSIRPEPNKRDSADALRLHRENQQIFEYVLYRAVHGPPWKNNFAPSAEIQLLQTLPHHNRQEWTPQIIDLSDDRICPQIASASNRARNVPLEAEVIYNLYRIE